MKYNKAISYPFTNKQKGMSEVNALIIAFRVVCGVIINELLNAFSPILICFHEFLHNISSSSSNGNHKKHSKRQ
jgi:hypothetical protein